MNVPYRRAWAEERAPGDPLNTDQRQALLAAKPFTTRTAVILIGSARDSTPALVGLVGLGLWVRGTLHHSFTVMWWWQPARCRHVNTQGYKDVILRLVKPRVYR